jgi:hypothetical protein
MWKFVMTVCLALVIAANAAEAFDDRGWRRDAPRQWAQGEYGSPFVAPRVPRPRSNPGWGGRSRAREGVRRGDIVSLDRVMNVVQRRYRGRVLNVRLDDRRLIYHLRLLTRRGQVLKITVDARTANILSVRGERRRR